MTRCMWRWLVGNQYLSSVVDNLYDKWSVGLKWSDRVHSIVTPIDTPVSMVTDPYSHKV